MVRPYPLRDTQEEAPAGYCIRCGAELYGDEAQRELCPECEKEENCEQKCDNDPPN